jgi:hypothetical protein
LPAISIPRNGGFGFKSGKANVGRAEVGVGKAMVGNAEFCGDNVLVGKEGLISLLLVDGSPRTVGVGNLVAVFDGAIVEVADGCIVFVGFEIVGVTVGCVLD